MLDYLRVKEFHAHKLAEDAAGGGRIESAFYRTMEMVYRKGVEDGEKMKSAAEAGLTIDRSNFVGIIDGAK